MSKESDCFDICFVTYNSSKWIDGCIEAVEKLDYNLKRISLYFVDNCSSDDSVTKLEHWREKACDLFGNFEILPQEDNRGFGAGNNIAAQCGSSDHILFLNVDTEIRPEALKIMWQEIREAEKEYAVFEMRQMPSEHSKYYDPITMNTSWANGACMVVRRSVFEEVGGFDETIFMYSEDVDLSWNIRAHGYKIRYVPGAVVNHYTNNEDNSPKRSEQIGSFAGRLILSYKYGSDLQVKAQEMTVRRTLWWVGNRRFSDELRQRLSKVYSLKGQYREFYKRYIEKNSLFDSDASIKELDEIRTGAFEKTEPLETINGIDFTIVVRTYKRPQLLSMTLESLTHQLYRNFNVIVIEDGEDPTSLEVVRKFENRLDISYHCLGYHGGRSVAANKGVDLANTRYINFLDDDDYLFADHLETMAYLINEHSAYRMFALDCMEGKVRYFDKEDPTSFYFVDKHSWNHGTISRDHFFFDNPLPIQSIAFEKTLYSEVGGIDEDLEAFEDWDLWMRMLIDNDIVYMNKATSLFKTPFDIDLLDKREEFMKPYRSIMKSRADEYRKSGNIENKLPEASGKNNDPDESMLITIRPYKEDESVDDIFTEIKHTKKWLLSLPLRLIMLLFERIKRPSDNSILNRPFGMVIYPWKKYSQEEREEIVNDILCSKCWGIVK